MNNLKRKTIIFAGIIVAALVIFSNNSKADTFDSKTLDKENYALAESLVNEMSKITDIKLEAEKVIKVYNEENRLVYESRNENDDKLKVLVNKSDLLTKVDNVVYYKLAH